MLVKFNQRYRVWAAHQETEIVASQAELLIARGICKAVRQERNKPVAKKKPTPRRKKRAKKTPISKNDDGDKSNG